MKRIALGIAALAAAGAMAAPATAGVYVKDCYATARYPCGVCVDDIRIYACVP